MDSLNSILGKRDFDVPPEVTAIKDYVRRHYDCDVHVQMRDNTIVVYAPNSSLIGTLRMQLPKLQKASGSDKRITLRIGSAR
ncbi:MAG: hypothetical protein WAS36_04905 [Candidatus Saccharimonadales bacterium]